MSEVVHSCHADLALCRAACVHRLFEQTLLPRPPWLADVGLCRGVRRGATWGLALTDSTLTWIL